jgi:predicted transcriptional regulator
MTKPTEIPALQTLDYIPYLDETGHLPQNLIGKTGVYAIFNQDQVLQFVGYSRDIYFSLKQHLIRQLDNCYWLKVETITRPNRTLLENIRQAWLQENDEISPGNPIDETKWTQAIDTKSTMTEAEKQEYEQADEMTRIKLLKKVARRVQAQIEEQLQTRGVQIEIRFNPIAKEKGLLDLKSVK